MKWARYNTQNECHDKRHQEDRKLSAYQLVCKVQPVLPLLGLILTSRPKVGWSQFGMFITGWLRHVQNPLYLLLLCTLKFRPMKTWHFKGKKYFLSTSHGKSSNIYTLNNQPNNSYTFMIKVKKSLIDKNILTWS